jgi:hypothetical protein
MYKFKQKNTLKYHYVFKYESLWALGDGQIQTQKYSKYYYVFKYESFLLSFGSP